MNSLERLESTDREDAPVARPLEIAWGFLGVLSIGVLTVGGIYFAFFGPEVSR